MYYFLGVNYGTCHIIRAWIESINRFEIKKEIVIVDNFKDRVELQNIIDLSIELGFTLLQSENVGYGRGLNKAINLCIETSNNEGDIIFAGNMDIEYTNIPTKVDSGNFVYVPQGMENNKKLNPFQTKIQMKIIGLYFLASRSSSSHMLLLAIIANKLLRVFPSKTWTIHGSLFCFNMKCLDQKVSIFNNNSFLYCEELEFGSYMERQGAIFIESDICYSHEAHVTTGQLFSTRKQYLKYWRPSFQNWIRKWR